MLRRLSRSFTTPGVGKSKEMDLEKQSPLTIDTQTTRTDSQTTRTGTATTRTGTATTRTGTATNALTFALGTLSAISNNVPMAGALCAIIDPLLLITARIKQTSDNAQALAQLADRIKRIAPILSQVAQEDPDRGQAMVSNLQEELTSMTRDLTAANSRGKLSQFFNSVDNASILQKHNNALAQMIAESTLVTVQEVAKSVQILRENSQASTQETSSPVEITTKMETLTVVGDITGGHGGPGGFGRVGGEGGDGEGPQVDIDLDEYKIGNIAGGTGGTGGPGIEVGGKGGIGKAPVIVLRRTKTLTTTTTVVESPTESPTELVRQELANSESNL
ncbi:hypothetical protein C8R45DRAFT_1036104 [Mycena sanguinolenta]|nr:hypothetical protein C8R45DRAFT_1036104 [Mycena sanguinolenta]